jgi:RNA polymerase sigma-70 factor (ECF subfamily)
MLAGLQPSLVAGLATLEFRGAGASNTVANACKSPFAAPTPALCRADFAEHCGPGSPSRHDMTDSRAPSAISQATARLLDRARAGDESARDALFTAAIPSLRVYVRARLGAGLAARVEPADVVQDALVAALPALAQFEPLASGSFVAWLCRIAERRIHALLDHFAAGKRRAAAPVTSWSAVATRLCAASTSPGSAVARADERERLAAALLGLADEREVVLQHWFEARSLREIAAAMQLPATTVHRLLGRAIARLGARLGGTETS